MLGMRLVVGILVWACCVLCSPFTAAQCRCQKELGASESSPPKCIKKDPESTQSTRSPAAAPKRAARLRPELPLEAARRTSVRPKARERQQAGQRERESKEPSTSKARC